MGNPKKMEQNIFNVKEFHLDLVKRQQKKENERKNLKKKQLKNGLVQDSTNNSQFDD